MAGASYYIAAAIVPLSPRVYIMMRTRHSFLACVYSRTQVVLVVDCTLSSSVLLKFECLNGCVGEERSQAEGGSGQVCALHFAAV